MDNENKAPISIKGIEVLSFSLNHRPIPHSQKLKYSIDINSSTKVEDQKKLVFIINAVKIKDIDGAIMSSIEVSVIFEIMDLDSHVTKQNDSKHKVDIDLEKKLTLTAMNTIRGISFMYLKGTYLQNVIIPHIDDSLLRQSK